MWYRLSLLSCSFTLSKSAQLHPRRSFHGLRRSWRYLLCQQWSPPRIVRCASTEEKAALIIDFTLVSTDDLLSLSISQGSQGQILVGRVSIRRNVSSTLFRLVLDWSSKCSTSMIRTIRPFTILLTSMEEHYWIWNSIDRWTQLQPNGSISVVSSALTLI